MSDAKKYGLIPSVIGNSIIIDNTDTEAFLVRKDADGGDIFVVDTTNGIVTIGGVTPVTGCRLCLPEENDAVTPTIAFGSGGVGIFAKSTTELGFSVIGAEVCRISGSVTARDTALMIYDVDNTTVERVSVGVADSGGGGYKVLRIPN